MNTEFLRSFVEVARQRNYTRAARALYLSQSAVYQHVRGLEQTLQAKLVEQSGKQVLLTPDGKLVLAQAVKVLDEVRRLLVTNTENPPPDAGALVEVAVGTTFGQSVLPVALARLQTEHPGIHVRAAIMHDTDMADDAVLRLGYDAAFHISDRWREGLHKDRLLDDILVAVLPAQHPCSTRKKITPRILEQERLITYSDNYPLKKLIDSWADAVDCRIPARLELNSQHAMVAAVRAGAGIAVVSGVTATQFASDPQLTFRSLSPPLRRTWYLITRQSGPPPLPALARLIDFMRNDPELQERDVARMLMLS